MWDAGVYPLAAAIAIFSCGWPYLKMFLLLVGWVFPMQVSNRQKLYHWIDVLGKWSLLDTYVMALMQVAFNFNIFLASGGLRITVYTIPRFGFVCFLFATCASLLAGHWGSFLHRLAASPVPRIPSDGPRESVMNHRFHIDDTVTTTATTTAAAAAAAAAAATTAVTTTGVPAPGTLQGATTTAANANEPRGKFSFSDGGFDDPFAHEDPIFKGAIDDEKAANGGSSGSSSSSSSSSAEAQPSASKSSRQGSLLPSSPRMRNGSGAAAAAAEEQQYQQQQYDKSAEAMDEEVIQGSRRRRRSPPQRTVRVGGGCNLLLQTVFVATLVAVVLGFVIHSFIFEFGGLTGWILSNVAGPGSSSDRKAYSLYSTFRALPDSQPHPQDLSILLIQVRGRVASSNLFSFCSILLF